VNSKRVLRLMKEDNLLALGKRRSVFTTDSRHTLPVYPNFAPALTLTQANQLWVADITYVRLREEFVYVAVILDAYSRRVVGWNLDTSMRSELVVRRWTGRSPNAPLNPALCIIPTAVFSTAPTNISNGWTGLDSASA
jgi:transposase InsO family protein